MEALDPASSKQKFKYRHGNHMQIIPCQINHTLCQIKAQGSAREGHSNESPDLTNTEEVDEFTSYTSVSFLRTYRACVLKVFIHLISQKKLHPTEIDALTVPSIGHEMEEDPPDFKGNHKCGLYPLSSKSLLL